MYRKNKLFIGILLVAVIAIAALLLFFILGRNNGREGIGRTKDDSPAIDYTKLDSALGDVPEYYTTFYYETAASHMSSLLDYIKDNKKTMTQETADEYAADIEEILKAYSSTDVPQVFIKTDSGELSKEYSLASVAIVDSRDGKSEPVIDLKANIKIRGNSTAEVAKKSYTIKLLNKRDVFGMGEAKRWVLTANPFDKSLMRNKLVFDFAAAIGLEYTPESTYVDVWMNGKFIGNFLLSEAIEASPSRVDINVDQGDFLIEREQERASQGTMYFSTPVFGYRFGVNEPENATKEQLTALKGFTEKIEAAMQAVDWEAFTGYVDEKSYIDFYILSELFKVVDFDYASTRYYIKNGKLYAGPVWDFDLSSGNADIDFYYDYSNHAGYGPDSSYIGLWCNKNFYSNCYEFPEFVEALRARYIELQDLIVNLYRDNSLGTNQIDLLFEKFGETFDRNYTTAGWTLEKEFVLERNPASTYRSNVEYLRKWLIRRNEYLLDFLESLAEYDN